MSQEASNAQPNQVEALEGAPEENVQESNQVIEVPNNEEPKPENEEVKEEVKDHEPPESSNEPPAQEAIEEAPQEDVQIPEEVLNKAKSAQTAEQNLAENE
ncbi:hypothetical protein M9Y10_009468 [Tritrichomonas musculus]|uniref:Uncharacterized protein n=1 Tax=Tritrichomonas musculus TaxID=1915356 RepID=A0ABR2INE8_9EUKA